MKTTPIAISTIPPKFESVSSASGQGVRLALGLSVLPWPTFFAARAELGQDPSKEAPVIRSSSPVAEFLKREIIGTNLAMEEVRRFSKAGFPGCHPSAAPPSGGDYAENLRSQMFERVVFAGRLRLGVRPRPRSVAGHHRRRPRLSNQETAV